MRMNAPSASQGSTADLLRVGRGLEGLARPRDAPTGAPGPRAGMTTRRLAGLLPLCHQGYRRPAGVPYRVATRYDSRMSRADDAGGACRGARAAAARVAHGRGRGADRGRRVRRTGRGAPRARIIAA